MRAYNAAAVDSQTVDLCSQRKYDMNAGTAPGTMMAMDGGPYPIRYTLHIPTGKASVEPLQQLACDLASVAPPLLGKKQRFAYLALFQPEAMHADPEANGCGTGILRSALWPEVRVTVTEHRA